MTERVGTVEHRRRIGAERPQCVSPGEQVAHQRFAAGNQLVGQHVPWAGLQATVPEQRRELGAALGPDGEVVVEDDRLAVEQEARAVRRRVR